ncbi:hypothetical protein [Carnobacterium funditum]|uniref:hypothetical protein n=1 Tax=Carnobacterium funditum TaxID=2752 RepID=UPI000AC5A31A|nr:hypothetical protein [Carnobacterium funditum]
MNDVTEGFAISGEIKKDDEGIYAKESDVIFLRKRLGMVFQKLNPFPMGISDNIA